MRCGCASVSFAAGTVGDVDPDGVELAELADLEGDALDTLEAFEDADSPAGTVSLEAARRRRALTAVSGVIARS
jgi:hypothetical protein